MKKLEIIIKPEKLEDLKGILDSCGAHGLMTKYTVNLLPKVKVETVVAEDIVEAIISKVTEQITTGNYGDGKIFVYDVEDAVRIRTGERGDEAL